MIEEANKKLLGVSDLREAIRKRREGRNANGKQMILNDMITLIAKITLKLKSQAIIVTKRF